MERQDSGDPKQSTADVSAFVQNLLRQMELRFQTMSEKIVSKIDEMGSQINGLEQSINKLRTDIGVDGGSSPLTSSQKPEEVEPEENSTA